MSGVQLPAPDQSKIRNLKSKILSPVELRRVELTLSLFQMHVAVDRLDGDLVAPAADLPRPVSDLARRAVVGDPLVGLALLEGEVADDLRRLPAVARARDLDLDVHREARRHRQEDVAAH